MLAWLKGKRAEHIEKGGSPTWTTIGFAFVLTAAVMMLLGLGVYVLVGTDDVPGVLGLAFILTGGVLMLLAIRMLGRIRTRKQP